MRPTELVRALGPDVELGRVVPGRATHLLVSYRPGRLLAPPA